MDSSLLLITRRRKPHHISSARCSILLRCAHSCLEPFMAFVCALQRTISGASSVCTAPVTLAVSSRVTGIFLLLSSGAYGVLWCTITHGTEAGHGMLIVSSVEVGVCLCSVNSLRKSCLGGDCLVSPQFIFKVRPKVRPTQRVGVD